MNNTLKYSLFVFTPLISLSPLIVYFLKFGISNGEITDLSNNLEDWARFGSFIGGTVGTIFAALAFMSVFISIREQRKQIKISESLRLISLEIESINQKLSTSVNIGIEIPGISEIPGIMDKTLINCLNFFGTGLINGASEDYAPLKTFNLHTRLQLFPLQQNIRHLCRLFDIHEKINGKDEIVTAYKKGICLSVLFLLKVSMKSDPLLEKHFHLHILERNFKDINSFENNEEFLDSVYG